MKKSNVFHLIANLVTRRRLGISRVEGEHKELNDLLRLLAGRTLTSNLTCIAKKIKDCIYCKLSASCQKKTLGQGIAPARFLFINKAPRSYEEKQGVPLTGTEVQLFQHMLTAVNLNYVDIYITNIIKCRPFNDRDPLSSEIAACWPFLKAEIHAICPDRICVLGCATTQVLLNNVDINYDIKDIYGKWILFFGIPLITIFHPHFLLNNSSYKDEAYKILKMLVKANVVIS